MSRRCRELCGRGQRPARRIDRPAFTLIEMVTLIMLTGTLMLITIRALHLAMKVHESGIQTATHLRLVHSLEDRLHSDIARAVEAESTATNRLQLVMSDNTEVIYELVKPNLLERKLLDGRASPDANQEAPRDVSPVVNQRWPFVTNYRLNIELRPVQARTLVQYRLRRSEIDSLQPSLREIEVSEVTHGR